MKGKVIACVVGVICITAMEITALLKGIDGHLFSTSLASVTGLVGYLFGRRG